MKRLAVFLLLLCPVAASGQVYRICESEAGFVRTRMKKIDSAIRVFRGRLTR